MCLGAGGSKIPFKKIRELEEFAVECTCQAACDQEADCIGFSLRRLGGPYGVSCRVYGMQLPGLKDGWDDLGSIGDPRYKGREIDAADGSEHNECYVLEERLLVVGGSPASAPAPAAAASPAAASALLQLHQFTHITHRMSAADEFAWQRDELKACQDAEAEHARILQERGCNEEKGHRHSVKLRGTTGIMPSECICECPICNWWQVPPPDCIMPPPPKEVEEEAAGPDPNPPTPPPPPPTPPAIPAEMPVAALPLDGDQYLPTLAPLQAAPAAAPAAAFYQVPWRSSTETRHAHSL